MERGSAVVIVVGSLFVVAFLVLGVVMLVALPGASSNDIPSSLRRPRR